MTASTAGRDPESLVGEDAAMNAWVEASLGHLDLDRVSAAYWRQGELLVLSDFLSRPALDALGSDLERTRASVHRATDPGYKTAGAIGFHALGRLAPSMVGLYRSPALLRFLSSLADAPLVCCPARDPHACALYVYTQPGDRVGFHYDSSFYRGARYTALLGLVNDSTSELVCRLHTRERRRPVREVRIATDPGTLVVFNGDKLYHSVSPLGRGESRVSLALQYVTSTEMGALARVVSDLKDALTYFGTGTWRASGSPSENGGR